MEQSESDERNDPTEGVVENEVGIVFSLINLLTLFIGDTCRRSARKSFKWRAFTHNGGYGCFMFVILLHYKIYIKSKSHIQILNSLFLFILDCAGSSLLCTNCL